MDSNFDPANSLINPGTTYDVKVDSIAVTRVLSSQSFTITTAAERICHKLGGATTYQNCPEVNISHENHSDSSLEFRIVKVPGASYYKVPGQLKCGVAMDQGFPGHLTGLGELLKWTPGPRVIKGGDWRDIYKDEYTVYYACLRANHSFKVTIEAHQYYTVTGVSNGESFSSKQSRLIAKSTMFMSTKPRTASSQQLGQQLAPTATPSPTAIPPIYIEVDYHGNHDTDVTLSWSAVNRASRYVLQVGGYTFNLGRSETSQRVNGLTPGADYTAYLTVYLPYGKKRTGTAHFGMADSLPTNTPIPPTSTPVPPPPPTNTPIPPPPPTNTPIPPPPPTNTPVPPPPPTNTPEQSKSQVDKGLLAEINAKIVRHRDETGRADLEAGFKAARDGLLGKISADDALDAFSSSWQNDLWDRIRSALEAMR